MAWKSLQMPLINCKVELKLKWTKHCALAKSGVDNTNVNHNIIFIINGIKFYVLDVTLLAKDNQKRSKRLMKGFKRSVYWNEHKTKKENKDARNKCRHFLLSNFVGVSRLFVLVCSNLSNGGKRFNVRRYYLAKGIIKNYDIIIDWKNFYRKPFDSVVKPYEEKRNLTTRQGEDYTTGYLLRDEYIKNHYRVAPVDLSRQTF